jgi:hypothetical protein
MNWRAQYIAQNLAAKITAKNYGGNRKKIGCCMLKHYLLTPKQTPVSIYTITWPIQAEITSIKHQQHIEDVLPLTT